MNLMDTGVMGLLLTGAVIFSLFFAIAYLPQVAVETKVIVEVEENTRDYRATVASGAILSKDVIREKLESYHATGDSSKWDDVQKDVKENALRSQEQYYFGVENGEKKVKGGDQLKVRKRRVRIASPSRETLEVTTGVGVQPK